MVTHFLKVYYTAFLPFVFCLFLLALFLLFQGLVRHSMIIPLKLFNEALKNENDGRFEEAKLGYESALEQVERKKFRGAGLKNKIIEKLKILHTVIEYSGGSNV